MVSNNHKNKDCLPAEERNNLRALFQKNQYKSIVSAYSQLRDSFGTSWILHNIVGSAFNAMDQYEEAEEHFCKALELNPNFYPALNNIGTLYHLAGKIDEAVESYTRAITINPTYTLAMKNLAPLKKFERGDPVIDMARSAIENDAISDFHKKFAHFAMGKVEEDLENYEQSFRSYCEGNTLKNSELNYDIKKEEDTFKKIYEISSVLSSLTPRKEGGILPLTPVFIVGMPRSGTSLVEQILSSHSKIHGGGELAFLGEAIENRNWRSGTISSSDLEKIRLDYLSSIEPLTQKSYITDKMPLNFLWIEFVLKAIPEAKIVHIVRDPRAVSWSIYKTYFSSPVMNFSFDQSNIAKYFNLYRELIGFLQNKYQGSFYTLDYESLTINLERESRSLLEYLDLQWEDSVLEFHKNERAVKTASAFQVRKKVYSGSSEKWKKYEHWISPQLKDLEPIEKPQ